MGPQSPYSSVFWAFVQNSYKAFVLGVAPTILVPGIVLIVLRLFVKDLKLAVIPASFATFGTVSGMLLGGSRQAVVSGALPLIVAMVTLFITFIVEKKDQDETRQIYMLSLLVFFIGTIFGAVYGAVLRGP